MILLIDNYDSFTYNLKQELESLGAGCDVRRNDAITLDEIEELAPAALVVSPGPGRPDEAGVSLGAILRFAGKIPVLGVCLGHQAIGQACGGRVVRARRPQHGKVSRLSHEGGGLFHGVETPFAAARYHSLVVERASLPGCLDIDAVSEDGEIMALRHRDVPLFGVQFHPESIATGAGRQILGNFLEQAGMALRGAA